MTFTNKELSDWKRYERVRKYGMWNMFSNQARAATGLTSDQYSFVMKNFSKLKEATEKKSIIKVAPEAPPSGLPADAPSLTV